MLIRIIALLTVTFTFTDLSKADTIFPFLSDQAANILQAHLSGTRTKNDLTHITRYHRMRGSEGFKEAARYIENQLHVANLDHVEILSFPADGKIFYGTQKSRPAWNAKSAELWLMEEKEGKPARTKLIARYADNPVILAQDSIAGSATGKLVDVGAGVRDSDYTDKAIAGNLVLTSSQPGAAAPLAITRYGAAGIISYAQNQKTAWWQADDRLIRWGHMDSFGAHQTFAFMVSLRQARAFQKKLANGEDVILNANVDAARSDGSYDIVHARINGADPSLKDEAIAFSCHLDHQKPGANDNASGCATILEIARSLKQAIDAGAIERPARPIIFFWPPEIEGTIALLNARVDFRDQIKSVIHMDMVGGGRTTKAIFRVSRGPMSLPSFVNDVAEAIAHTVNDQTARFASGEDVAFPLIAQDGGREALQAITGAFSLGSDHQVYTDSSFSIPSIYLHDWPDRFIHTNFDTPANIDPTKLKRAGFIGAASALTLANWSRHATTDHISITKSAILRRTASILARCAKVSNAEAQNILYHHWRTERAAIKSAKLNSEDLEKFILGLAVAHGDAEPIRSQQKDYNQIFKRTPSPLGPMNAFGYSYLADKLGVDKLASLSLPNAQNMWGASGSYSYEALNLADGNRSVQDIRNILSAEFGPVETEHVLEYLNALASIGVVEKVE